MNIRLKLEDFTLDELYELEAEHPPLVGARTSVFLDSHERAVNESGPSYQHSSSAEKGNSVLREGAEPEQ